MKKKKMLIIDVHVHTGLVINEIITKLECCDPINENKFEKILELLEQDITFDVVLINLTPDYRHNTILPNLILKHNPEIKIIGYSGRDLESIYAGFEEKNKRLFHEVLRLPFTEKELIDSLLRLGILNT